MKTLPAASHEKRKIRPATIHEHLRHQDERKNAGRFYPESHGNLAKDALDDADPMQAKLRGAGNMSPEDRADTGGLVGAFLGNKVAGAHGSVIGAAIGSDAVRGLGMAQSGENQLQQNKSQVIDTLQKMKVIDDEGEIEFKDGAVLSVGDTETPSLMNTSPSVQGKPKRTVYELDPTNPFTSRTTPIALPLSYYIVGALLKQTEFQDPMTLKTIDCVATLFTNALQVGAKNMGSIESRAQELAKKIGASKTQLQNFFYQYREAISAKDADKIKTGMDVLYRKAK